MPEYELFELLQGSYEQMNVDATIYFTLVSAYLVVAFLVGSSLTRIQLFGFMLIQACGIIASLHFTWSVRHTKTE